jgi:hypothetical protein
MRFQCSNNGCKCTNSRISRIFQETPRPDSRESNRELGKYNCKSLQTLKNTGHLSDKDKDNYLLFNSCKVELLRESSTSDGEPNLYTFLEMPNQLTLSGESGKFTGVSTYWDPVHQDFLQNKDKNFSVLSIGGGCGYDGEAIANVLKNKGLNVSGVKINDNNPIIPLLDPNNKTSA